MAKRFTRNIKDTTKITDEPLYTNSQNDIISDDTDVAIRHKDEYHYLTDNIKNLSSGDTDRLTITSTGKNARRITPSENLVLRSEMSDYVDSKIDEIEVPARVWWLGNFNGVNGQVTFTNNLPTPDNNYNISVHDLVTTQEINFSVISKSETYITIKSDDFVSGKMYRILIHVSDNPQPFSLVFTALNEIGGTSAGRVWWLSSLDKLTNRYTFITNIPTPDTDYDVKIFETETNQEIDSTVSNKLDWVFSVRSNDFVSGKMYQVRINVSDEAVPFKLIFPAV